MRSVFVCATDATATSMPALRFSLQLAHSAGSSLVLLHVVETLDERLRWYVPSSPTERLTYKKLVEKRVVAVEQRLRQQVVAAAGQRSSNAVKILVKSGDVEKTVLETAMALDANLIVLGKGKKPGLIATTAERIARSSSRPVLLVPPKWTRGARLRILRPATRRRRAVSRAAS